METTFEPTRLDLPPVPELLPPVADLRRRRRRTRIAAVVALLLALALAGTLIAFGGGSATGASADDEPTADETATTLAGPSTTLTPPDTLGPATVVTATPATTPPAPPEPPAADSYAELTVGSDHLDFGHDLDELTFRIRNTGDADGGYRARGSDPWIAVNPSVGDVPADGGEVIVDVTVDRSGLEGFWSGEVTVTTADEEVIAVITVEGQNAFVVAEPSFESVSYNPVVCALTGPVTAAHFTPVVADITNDHDQFNPEVTLRWQLYGSSYAKVMQRNDDGNWVATLGPWPPSAPVNIWVEITSDIGDAWWGPGVINVIPCPHP